MRLNIVLRYAFALGVHEAKIKLSVGVPLIRSLTIPTDSFSIVLRPAFAFEVHHTKI